MSLDLKGPGQPVRDIDELVEYIRSAERPRTGWMVGVEHEKIGVDAALNAVQYRGPGGIRELLDALARAAGDTQHKHKENGQPIALIGENASVTLEPGGQLELSGAPSRSLAAVQGEIERHLAIVREKSRGPRWLACGYRPFGTRADVPWMPKGRYGAMKASLGPRDRLSLDMMLMTGTVQANLDWSDEADLAEKVRTATAISPIVTAIFANSPIVDGKDSGYLDFRYQVWRETDPVRCGLLEDMLKPGWSYRKYVDWALDVPMLFVRRGTDYTHAGGQTFRQYLTTGRLANGEQTPPLFSNWVDHLTTLFPEIRVKRVLEVRGTDVVPLPQMMAHTALWVGLLYDAQARAAAWELTRRWPFDELLAFQADVARSALQARSRSGALALDLARELLEIARGGLAAWANDSGIDERAHLDAAADIVASGKTLAERALAAWYAAGKDPQALVRFWQIA
jgi:glutamate--cysteine ligase